MWSVSFFAIFSFCFFDGGIVNAVENAKVDYKDEVIVDSDLDGITDKGEQQIYGSNPAYLDTDGDGFYDGSEVLAGTDPLDPNNIYDIPKNLVSSLTEKETPWAWYIVRMSGLVGFALLYFSVFFGLAINLPILNKLIKPVYSYSVHCWISFQALLFVFIHGTGLLFDHFMKLKLMDVFIPFAYKGVVINANFLAAGIIGFYLMLILVVSSYLKKFMSHGLWRALHFLNIILYVSVVVHALMIGTDLKFGIAKNIFISANVYLTIIFFLNIIFRIKDAIKKKMYSPENSASV